MERTTGRSALPAATVRLLLAWAAFIFIGANDGTNGVLLPSLETAYGLNKSSVSTLFFAGTIGFLVAAFSSGMLTERLGRRMFLSLGATMMLLGMSTIATQPPWGVVLLALMAVGLGAGMIDAGLNAFVASLPNNTALLNYLHAFYGVGALIGPLLASNILAVGWNWNVVYMVLAVVAASVLLTFALAFTNTAVQTSPETAAQSNVMAATLRLPIVWLAAIFLLVYVGAEVSLGSWTYSLLTEQRGISVVWAGRLVSGYWLGLTLGRLVLGSITRRFGNRTMIHLCLATFIAAVLLLLLVQHPLVTALALLLAGFSLGPIFPTMIAVMAQVVAPRLLPSVVGFIASFGAMGAALFPWIAGKLAHRWGIDSIPLYVVGLALIMIGLWIGLQQRRAAMT